MRPEPSKRVVEWMDSIESHNLGITSITVAEILYGIAVLSEGRRKSRLLEAARVLFEDDFNGRIFAFDEQAAVEYADIIIRREMLGSPISMPDAQIAAICRASDCALATRNIKDFEEVGIELIDPFDV
jgi:hypothetical protein